MILLQAVLLVLGFALLVKGADWLVEGSSSLARRWGISELAIGLTLVAFGTSMPELTVNVISSLRGADDIAIGNVVGSNIANILLILGVAALYHSIKVQRSTVWKEIPFSLLAAAMLLAMANDRFLDGASFSGLGRADGIAFLGFFLIFLWYIFGMQKAGEMEATEHVPRMRPLWLTAGMVVAGLLLLMGGGKLVVDSAIVLASALGASQALLGLTVVAVGTSLPEMATSVVAARKGKADIAVGNVVGSNIFNIFFILGISALIKPLSFHPQLTLDLLVAALATLFLFFAIHTGAPHRRLLFWRQREGHVIQRIEGVLMLAAYAAYVGFLVWRG